MIAALTPKYQVDILSVDDFQDFKFQSYDCVAFPGGIGDSDSFYSFFKRRHANAVAAFLANGGKYLGICMGAYWTGSNYFDILEGLDCVQYIQRPSAEIRRPYGTVADITYQDNSQDRMFFYDGSAIIETDSSAKYKVIARYKNGDAMAVIQNNIGIIGCHPESEKFWYDMYPYIQKDWHEHRHHKFLLDFVDQLMLN